MRKRGLIAVLLAVAVAAGAGIFIYSYARRHARGIAPAADNPALLDLVPADSTILFYADLEALRSSPFVTQLAALVPPVTKDRDYAEFVRATGFDYERDLDRVVLTMQGERKNPVTTAIADGRFDQDKIAAYALRAGKLEKQNGGDVYVIPAKSPGKTVVIRFLSDATTRIRSRQARIALTDGPKLWPTIAPASSLSSNRASNRASNAASKNEPRNDHLAPEMQGHFAPEMQERIARVSGAPLFAVAKLDSAMQKKNFVLGGLRSDQLENLARSVRWLSLAALPEGDRVHVALEGECDTTENARQLAGTLDGLRIMGRMALADPKTRRQIEPAALPLLEALLRGTEVSRDDKGSVHRVRLTLVISQKTIGAGAAAK